MTARVPSGPVRKRLDSALQNVPTCLLNTATAKTLVLQREDINGAQSNVETINNSLTLRARAVPTRC